MSKAVRLLGYISSLSMVLSASPIHADLWSGFYQSTHSPAPLSAAPARAVGCFDAVVDAQRQFQIPDNILLAIGIQEAGRKIDGKVSIWPWAVNAEGKSIYFKTREQAIAWVRDQQAQGVRSIDVGCMQINLHWHKGAFASLEDAFDPIANATYAARFLSDLKRSEGSWWRAAGSYHSRTDIHRDRYLASLSRNQRVANAHFEHMAGRANQSVGQVASSQAATLPIPTVLWGVSQTDQGVFSIYSRKPLTPVLPVFEEGS